MARAAARRRLRRCGSMRRRVADRRSGSSSTLPQRGAARAPSTPTRRRRGREIVLVLGGDGTILRGAELARPAGVPLLGVNLGHVGFLAEAEPRRRSTRRVDRDRRPRLQVEERMTLDVVVTRRRRRSCGARLGAERGQRREGRARAHARGRPRGRRPAAVAFGCDGVLCATPTGSTAYAFSAGGPVVWPDVEALLLVPISAHALFARPLVVSPHSRGRLEVLPARRRRRCWCATAAGRSTCRPGARVEVRRGATPVRLARLRAGAVHRPAGRKFELPVQGCAGRRGAGLDGRPPRSTHRSTMCSSRIGVFGPRCRTPSLQ